MGQDTIQDCVKPLSEMTLEELWQLFPIILSGHDPDWKKYYEEEKHCWENLSEISWSGSSISAARRSRD